jgi:ABC-type transporter Mla subunit MlaD
LEVGSPVKFQGVPVGTIKSIEVAPDGRLIEVIMQIGHVIQVNDSLRVKAELAGIAGGKFLQLYYPTSEEIKKMYPEISFKSKYPYIKSAPSGIEEIEIAMRETLENLRHFRFEDISNEMVNFLRSSTGFFANKDLYMIITKMKNAADLINDILAHTDSTNIVNNLELTSQKLLQITVELEYFSNNLNNQLEKLELGQRVDNAFKQYDTTVIDFRRTVNVLGFHAETVLFGLNETLEDLKATNKQLRKSLRAIGENPSQVFFSEPPPKEK